MKRNIFIATLCAAALGLASLSYAKQPGTLPENDDATAVQPTDDVAAEDTADTSDATTDDAAPAEMVPGFPLMAAPPRQYIPPLGYNHYYPAPGSPYMPARLYMSPRPVPPRVGYTYITYQAFAPHEYLHPHARWYYAIHPGSGTTITKITWR